VLIAQISDTHIKPEGSLAYGRVDTSAFLARRSTTSSIWIRARTWCSAPATSWTAGLLVEYAHLRHLLSPLPMPRLSDSRQPRRPRSAARGLRGLSLGSPLGRHRHSP
jgi:hypothetical protein